MARSRPRLVFLFPGQGVQFPGRDRALYRTAPVFRDTLDEASALLGPVHGRPLVDWGVDPDADPGTQALTEVAQPLLVASGVALARQLRDWGVEPDAVAGHSVGEITAACVSGVLTLRDAVRFAAERGRLMGAFTEPGAMIAIRGGEEAVAAAVAGAEGDLAVAAYNGPGLQVLSGSVSAVERAAHALGAQGVPVRRLRVSRAFHSPLMRPIADQFAAAARALTLHEPSVPLISTVTGEWQPVLGPEYLRDHALRPVLFGAAVERLAGEGYDHVRRGRARRDPVGCGARGGGHGGTSRGRSGRQTWWWAVCGRSVELSPVTCWRPRLCLAVPTTASQAVPATVSRAVPATARSAVTGAGRSWRRSGGCGRVVCRWTGPRSTPATTGFRCPPIPSSAGGTGLIRR
ncbi:hypothetical protein SMICM304S_01894 [Streptomyces microflavus]